MADNPTVANSIFSTGLPDIPVRGTANSAGKVIQHGRIDIGVASAESQVTPANPLPIVPRNSSGTEIGTLANPVRINPTGTTTQPVSLLSETIDGIISSTTGIKILAYDPSAFEWVAIKASATGQIGALVAQIEAEAVNTKVSGNFASTALTAAGTSASINTRGAVYVSLSGTHVSATLQFEYSLDGSTYSAATLYKVSDQTAVTSITGTNILESFYGGPFGPSTTFRVRLSAITSGSVTVALGAPHYQALPATIVTKLPAITGTVAATQSGTWNVTNVSGTISLPTGAATSALQTTPATAGGWTASYLVSLTNTGSTNATPRKFGGYVIGNFSTTTAALVRFYDKATAATGSDTPFWKVQISPGAAANIEFQFGIPLTNGLSVRAVTGIADSNTTSPTANEVFCTILYV